MFRSLLQRETRLPAWRDLAHVYRRLEARRRDSRSAFTAASAVSSSLRPTPWAGWRAVRKAEKTGELVVLSAADPLNLIGVVTPEARVPAIQANRLLFKDGLAVAALEGGELRPPCSLRAQ